MAGPDALSVTIKVCVGKGKDGGKRNPRNGSYSPPQAAGFISRARGLAALRFAELAIAAGNRSFRTYRFEPAHTQTIKKAAQRGRFFNGRGERIRTSGLLLPKQTRYQAALRPDFKNVLLSSDWSGREDSNLRPAAPKTAALPGCATPRCPATESQEARLLPFSIRHSKPKATEFRRFLR